MPCFRTRLKVLSTEGHGHGSGVLNRILRALRGDELVQLRGDEPGLLNGLPGGEGTEGGAGGMAKKR